MAEIFVQLVHRLETNTINSLWANWIRAAQRLLRIHHPEMNAQEREKHFEKIMRGECSDPLLPLLPLSAEHVRKAIALLQCSLPFLHRNRTLSCLTRSRDCLPSLSATSISASSPGGNLSGICIASRHSMTRTQAFCALTLITARVFHPQHPLPTYLQKDRWCTFGD